MFGGVYITPSESLYFRSSTFAELQAKTHDTNKSYVFGGDVNSRCGELVNELIADREKEWRYTYEDESVNANGKELLHVCKDNDLLMLNGLQTLDI